MQIIRTKDEKEKKKQKVKTQPLIGQQTLMVWDESRFIFYLFENSFIENPSESG